MWAQAGCESGEQPDRGASSLRVTPLFLPDNDPASLPSPSAADRQQQPCRSEADTGSSPAVSAASPEWPLPRAGSHRRAVYDTVIGGFPDVSPPYLLQRLNVHQENATRVLDELFRGGYPLVQGSFQVRFDPSSEGGGDAQAETERSQFKHHIECQCCLERVPRAQVGEYT